MPNAARFSFVDEDNTEQVKRASLGISGVAGVTQRGPVNDASTLIVSEEQFLKLYGGKMSGNDFPELCLRYLRKGNKLRVNRITHYTTIGDASTLTALKPGIQTFVNTAGSPENLFTMTPKYPGADYNNLRAEVKAASNGDSTYFDLVIWMANDVKRTTETYTNLNYVPVNLSDPATDQHLFQRVNSKSQLITIAPTGNSPTSYIAAYVVKTFTGGSDGGSIVPSDYIGVSTAQTGLYAFDAFDDMMQVAIPNMYSTAINNGGAVYATGRKDLMFFAHLDPVADFTAIIAAAAAVTSADEYTAFFTGGIMYNDDNQMPKSVSEVADALSIAGTVDTKYGPWYTLSNVKRGLVNDATGVAINFGGDGNYTKLNALANAGINAMVAENGQVYLSGNFTGYKGESKRSYLSIMRLLIYIKKSLSPTFKSYLEEPMDIPTFIKLANEVEPFLQTIQDQRGLYAFDWDGDQNVGNINDVRVNNLADIDLGKYKANLMLEPINGIGEIIVGISLNKTGTISLEIEDTLI